MNAVAELYNSIVKGVRVALVLVLLLGVFGLVLLPLAFLFGFWLSRKRNYLVKNMRDTALDLNNTEQYVTYKNKLNKLTKDSERLVKVSSYNLKKVPLFVRYPVAQMKYLSSTLLTYEGWLQSRLTKYNQEQFQSEQKIFSFKPESELWDNRNKVYNYWM